MGLSLIFFLQLDFRLCIVVSISDGIESETNMLPGIYNHLTNQEYHSEGGLSASGLKELAISPKHFQEYKSRPIVLDVKLESMVHAFVLEPKKAEDMFAIVGDRRTKQGKADYEAAIAAGRQVVKQDDLDKAREVSFAVLRSKSAAHYFTGGANENSVFVEDKDLGVMLKIRPDAWIQENNTIVDLKVISRGMSKFQLENLTRTRGWDIQAAFYMYVMKQYTGKYHEFVHVFVEKEAPHGVRVMKINEQSIENAMKQILPLIHQYAQCVEKNEWPGYCDVMEEMNIRRFVEEEAF